MRALILLLSVLLSPVALAELTASVDRDRVAVGDTIRLTISATGNEPINNVDLRPLVKDFEILGRSNSSSTNIINGRRTSTRQVILDITSKREGTVRIPALRAGQAQTNFILVSVSPATTSAGDPLVSFEAELDNSEVFVQGQAVLTLRLQQAINLESRSITELSLDNAFVKPLEQQSFQRTIDGRPWLVYEVRYAIFPEQSGKLTIPAQTFSARESQPRRSMFDSGNSGKSIRRTTDALTLTVLPKPADSPGDTWLPAANLTIEEHWSAPPEQLRVGESATRRITVTGQGLQGAQLPPISFPATPGLKYYPDQPVINDSETSDGLLGSRVDSAALVPTRTGQWTLPEIRIPWMDTRSGEVRYAVLKQRTVIVGEALEDVEYSPPPLSSQPAVFDSSPLSIARAATEPGMPWKTIAYVSLAGWLITALYAFRRPRKQRTDTRPIEQSNLTERQTFKTLLAACAANNVAQARSQLIDWTAALTGDTGIHSLDQVEDAFNNNELRALIRELNTQLYSSSETIWDGQALAALARTLKKGYAKSDHSGHGEFALYPD